MDGLLAATIFVEGKDDLDFVSQCMRHWGFSELLVAENKMKNEPEKICLRFIGGNEGQLFSKGALPILKGAIRLSKKTLFLLDADKDPCGKRKRLSVSPKSTDWTVSIWVRFSLSRTTKIRVIWKLCKSRFRAIRSFTGCFDRYLECVQSVGQYKLPDDKDKVYAYTKAVCDEKPLECNYFDARHWITDSPLLQSLEAFLKNRLSAHRPTCLPARA